jgi:beta-mannosidase
MGPAMQRWGAEKLILQLSLKAGAKRLSENTIFLTAPRFMELPKAGIRAEAHKTAPGRFELKFSSPAYQHQVRFSLGALGLRASDNFFDLYPGQGRRISVRTARDLALAQFKRRLRIRSLTN